MSHVWGTGQVHVEFWWGNLRERDHLEDIPVDETLILKSIFQGTGCGAWTGLIWLRTVAGVGLL
jgi:hypothetical protein